MQVWLHPHIFHCKMSDGMLSAFLAVCGTSSFVPRPLPDFILQQSVEGLVPLLRHEHRNNGNMSTQYVASTINDQTVKFA